MSMILTAAKPVHQNKASYVCFNYALTLALSLLRFVSKIKMLILLAKTMWKKGSPYRVKYCVPTRVQNVIVRFKLMEIP